MTNPAHRLIHEDTQGRNNRMTSIQDHYDRLLGPIYGWMLGNGEETRKQARQELHEAGIYSGEGVAVDLGSGNGSHAIPLAELGYAVVAIDTCQALLDELRQSSDPLAITTIQDSLEAFRRHCPTAVDVVICMGDTLTHLQSREAVQELIADVAEALRPGGIFVTTFRDYVTAAPEGAARFIPVKSDTEKILTCFLEYSEDRVMVYDMLHTRSASGWVMTVSAYPKIRLEPAWVATELEQLGLQVCRAPGQRGMVRITARKSAHSTRKP